MSVPYGVLGLLQPQPLHGYEIKQRFDALLSPDRPLAFGQVYATLGRLERDGQVGLVGVERDGGPDRKRYGITEAGRSTLETWIGTPLEPEPHLQAELYTKVVLAVLVGASLDELLDRQRHAHLERMRVLTELRRSTAPAMALLADYALFHLEADLRWIELTAARVEVIRDEIDRRAGKEAAR